MASFGDLKTRIISETNRDDLSDALAPALARAVNQSIEFYAPQRFWFNEAILPSTTTPGSEYVTIPPSIRTLDRVGVVVGGSQYRLKVQSYVTIEDWAKYNTSQGQPTDYCVLGAQIRLYPKPLIAYTMSFLGVVNLAALSADGDSNQWTNEAQDLIAARARKLLFRDQFRDNDGAAVAETAESEAYSRLLSESTRRLSTGRVRPHG